MKKITAPIKKLFPVAQEIESKIREYYNRAYKKEPYAFANVLDPRIKFSWLTGNPDLKKFKQNFSENASRYSKYVAEADNVIEDNSQSADDEDLLSNIFKRKKISDFHCELKEDLKNRGEDPMLNWKLKQDSYPSLATMAKKYLSIPATSTPAERVFSKGRLLISHTRNRLSSDRIQALLCLNDWKKNKLLIECLFDVCFIQRFVLQYYYILPGQFSD